jgi:WD40 repeat protein
MDEDGKAFFLENIDSNVSTKINPDPTTKFDYFQFIPETEQKLGVFITNNGNGKIYDFQTKEFQDQKSQNQNLDDIDMIKFTQDMKYAITRKKTSKNISILSVQKETSNFKFNPFKKLEQEIDYFAIKPINNQENFNYIIATATSKKIQLWEFVGNRDNQVNLTDKDMFAEFTTNLDKVGELIFSPDGKILIARGGKGIELWDMTKIELLQLLQDGCSRIQDYLKSESEGKLLGYCQSIAQSNTNNHNLGLSVIVFVTLSYFITKKVKLYIPNSPQ